MKLTLEYKLLDHPFYKAWTCGDITIDQLAAYASGYADFISEIPSYWEKSLQGLDAMDKEGKTIIEDETRHAKLWSSWASSLPKKEVYPKLDKTKEALSSLSPSALLGAIHAFEIQQPEVAKTKKEGLLKYYGIKGSSLAYFDEHEDEASHIAHGKRVAEKFANREEFTNGFNVGQKVFYDALDAFI